MIVSTPTEITRSRPQEQDLSRIFRARKLIVVTGIDNPAATWLFDLCRLTLSELEPRSYCCSLEQLDATKAREAEIVLLRAWTPDEALATLAWRTFSMHRDLRELSLESGRAAADHAEDTAHEAIDRCVRNHAFWAARSHLALGYEDAKKHPGETLRVIAHSLGKSVGAGLEEHLVERLRNTRAEFCSEASQPRRLHGEPENPQRDGWAHDVESRFGWWLKEYGYRTAKREHNGMGWTSAKRSASPPVWAPPPRKIPTPDSPTDRRVLVLYELADLDSSYSAFSYLSNLHRQLEGASSVESLVLGNYGGPDLPKGSAVLRQNRHEAHRRDDRFLRRLISVLRRKRSSFRWFSNIDQRREATIDLLRTARKPWTDVVLFITDVEFGVDLVEFLFLFLDHLPERVVAVLPASTGASRVAIERMRYFGVRVLFDASDYGEPTMRFAGTGMLRSFDDDLENPLHPRKAPMVDWHGELNACRFQEWRPETVLFIHPDWEHCGSATTFTKLSRLFRLRGAIQIDVALQPYRVERDIGYINKKLAKLGASPRPTLNFEIGRRWPLERLAQLALGWRSWCSRIKTTTAYVMAFYSQCVTPGTVKRFLRSAHIDYVYLNHYFTFRTAGKLRANLPLLMDTHDVQSTNFVEHNYPVWLGGPASSFKGNLREEIEIMSKATMLTMVSQDEIDLVLTQRPALDIFHYIPIPTVEAGTETAPVDIVGPRQIRLLIVASRNPANERSLCWFLKSVWPYVSSQHLVLDVVGAIDSFFVGKRFPHVHFHGMVDSLQNAYRQADLVILPVTNGGGIAIKTLEAIEYQKALIATTHAFRGLPADIKADMPLCIDETQMIDDIVQLTNSIDARAARERIVQGLKRKLAARNFDGILEERLDRMLQLSPSRARGRKPTETTPDIQALTPGRRPEALKSK